MSLHPGVRPIVIQASGVSGVGVDGTLQSGWPTEGGGPLGGGGAEAEVAVVREAERLLQRLRHLGPRRAVAADFAKAELDEVEIVEVRVYDVVLAAPRVMAPG